MKTVDIQQKKTKTQGGNALQAAQKRSEMSYTDADDLPSCRRGYRERVSDRDAAAGIWFCSTI